jgi:hypothetical protein
MDIEKLARRISSALTLQYVFPRTATIRRVRLDQRMAEFEPALKWTVAARRGGGEAAGRGRGGLM